MSDLNVQRLRRLDACAVSDALDKLQLPGVVTGLTQRSGGGRIAGRAVTMKVGPGQPPPGPARHLGCTAIEQSGADNVIVVELGVQVPVTIGAAQGGEVTVVPGDYVLADRSAVIFIAAADIDRVLEAAEMIVAKEAAMAKAILAGTPIGEVMGGNYEHMLMA